jgi:hypothetical protein
LVGELVGPADGFVFGGECFGHSLLIHALILS